MTGSHLDRGRGMEEEAGLGWAIELTLGHGELVYKWDVEPKMSSRQLEFGSWQVGSS